MFALLTLMEESEFSRDLLGLFSILEGQTKLSGFTQTLGHIMTA